MQIQYFRHDRQCVQSLQSVHVHIQNKITNLIKYGLGIGVTSAYNTTNTPKKLSSQQYMCNVTCNKTAFHTIAHCFASKWTKCKFYSNHNTFSQTCSFHILQLKTAKPRVRLLPDSFVDTCLILRSYDWS